MRVPGTIARDFCVQGLDIAPGHAKEPLIITARVQPLEQAGTGASLIARLEADQGLDVSVSARSCVILVPRQF